MENVKSIEIEDMEKLELSYWLRKYLESSDMTEEEFAVFCDLEIGIIRSAVAQKCIPRSAIESICVCIHRPYELLRVAPIEDPAVKAMIAMLALESRDSSAEAKTASINGAHEIVKENFPTEDIERASQWLRYLLLHPNSEEAVAVILQMDDIIKDCNSPEVTPQKIIADMVKLLIKEIRDTATLDQVAKTLNEARRTVRMREKHNFGDRIFQRIRTAFQNESRSMPAPGYTDQETPEAIERAKGHITPKGK